MPHGYDLSRFFDFWKAHKLILATLATTAAGGPFADFVFSIGPPWPEPYFARSFISIIPVFIALTLTFRLGQRNASDAVLDRQLLKIGILTSFFLVLYIVILVFSTFTNPATGRYASKGLIMRAELVKALDNKSATDAPVGPLDLREVLNSHSDDEQLLEGVGYDARRIWVPWTVSVIDLALLLAWLAMFTSLETFIGTFVLLNPAKIPA